MAEIENVTFSSGSGRPNCGLDFAGAKSACTGLERTPLPVAMVVYG